ncbi:von Willebrand factor type A domain-containing protein [Kocuria rhizophila]|uniref:VWA domain-containing protein n=1 Tax=Kocuria rhizophila TaxID=72000 RepID=UPI00190C77C0|nr:VWA domain-containing protein [Kocuria rhizophila]MBK4119837.1 VWA domain-containing protein [Kocuria rhizophila]MCC5673303.1 VWA domain-containing protein [Kocuria rhizophila]
MTEPEKQRGHAAHRAERRGPSRALLWIALAVLAIIGSTVFALSRLAPDDDAAPGGSEASGPSGAASAGGEEPVVVGPSKTTAGTWAAVLLDPAVELGAPGEDTGTRELISRALGEARDGQAERAATEQAMKRRARTEGDAAPVQDAARRLQQVAEDPAPSTAPAADPSAPAYAAGAQHPAATVVTRGEWEDYRSRHADTTLVASTPGDRPASEAPTADDAALTQALGQWQHLAEPFHALVAIDVSGSMGTKALPDGSTRMDLTKAAATTAVGLFPEHDALGLWTFERHLDGDKDYRSVTPVRELSASVDGGTQRDQLSQDVQSLTFSPDGYTGLYDTTLAAYRQVLHDDAPGHLRTVIVLSDGMNHDPDSIALDELLSTLKAEQDAENPVRIITVGVSKDADATVLRQIAEATGGSSHVARTPQDIQKVFVDALTGA